MWYPRSGVVLDCIGSRSLPSFLLCMDRRMVGQIKAIHMINNTLLSAGVGVNRGNL